MKIKLLEEAIFDTLNHSKWKSATDLCTVEPEEVSIVSEQIKKDIEKLVRKIVYLTIARWTQGKTKDYLPIAQSSVILGKRKTLERLKRGIDQQK